MENRKKPKLWGILNIFDIVLILVAILLGVVIFMARSGGDEEETPTGAGMTPLRYTVEFTNLREEFADSVQVGDQFIDKIKKYSMGTVESVEVTPNIRDVVDYDNARVVRVETPGYVTLLVTIVGEATQTEKTILMDGGYEMRVGMGVNAKSPRFSANGTVLYIEREGE